MDIKKVIPIKVKKLFQDKKVIPIKVKKLFQDASVPEYATSGAACFDIRAYIPKTVRVFPGCHEIIATGLMFEIPENHVMLIYSRSGHGFTRRVRLSNCTGVIDSDYRGEVRIAITCDGGAAGITINNGDRIAQGIVIPYNQVSFQVVDELGNTERNEGGFGSTGTN